MFLISIKIILLHYQRNYAPANQEDFGYPWKIDPHEWKWFYSTTFCWYKVGYRSWLLRLVVRISEGRGENPQNACKQQFKTHCPIVKCMKKNHWKPQVNVA